MSLGDTVLGILRRAPEQKAAILAIHNVTEAEQTIVLDLDAVGLAGILSLRDIISGREDLHPPVSLPGALTQALSDTAICSAQNVLALNCRGVLFAVSLVPVRLLGPFWSRQDRHTCDILPLGISANQVAFISMRC